MSIVIDSTNPGALSVVKEILQAQTIARLSIQQGNKTLFKGNREFNLVPLDTMTSDHDVAKWRKLEMELELEPGSLDNMEVDDAHLHDHGFAIIYPREESPESILAWTQNTFGPRAVISQALRMQVEMLELLMEIELAYDARESVLESIRDAMEVIEETCKIDLANGEHPEEDLTLTEDEWQTIRNEAADVMIIFTQVCRLMMLGDLWEEVNKKMQINRNRNWYQMDNGRWQHSEKTTDAADDVVQ